MRAATVLVTGANGEIGHGLLTRLAADGRSIVTLDIAPLEPQLAKLVRREFTGSITDLGLLERILSEFEIDLVFHLAALLSTRSEFTYNTPSGAMASMMGMFLRADSMKLIQTGKLKPPPVSRSPNLRGVS